MPFPTKDKVDILSLRANDTKADDGVLPESGVSIIEFKDAKHIDMCDRGSAKIKTEIKDVINKFLRGKL